MSRIFVIYILFWFDLNISMYDGTLHAIINPTNKMNSTELFMIFVACCKYVTSSLSVRM